MGEQNDRIFHDGKINKDILFSIILERTIQAVFLSAALVSGILISIYLISRIN
jgi:hypothetical protein